MKKLRVTVEPFQGTIPFRILQRGRVLVEGSFSGKCTQLHSRTFQVNATNLFDKKYFTTCEDAFSCYEGDRRSVIGRVKVSF